MENRKISYFVPIVLAILLVTSIPPISYIQLYLGIPVRILLSPLRDQQDQQFVDNFNKEKELFPMLPEWSTDKDGETVALKPEELKKVQAHNQTQLNNIMNYRASHQSKPSLVKFLGNIIYTFAGQFTIIIIAIIYYIFQSRRKRLVQVQTS